MKWYLVGFFVGTRGRYPLCCRALVRFLDPGANNILSLSNLFSEPPRPLQPPPGPPRTAGLYL